MLLFDAIDIKLKPLVAYLQQASRRERSPALYDQCVAALEQALSLHDDAAFILIAQAFGLVIDQQGYSDASIAWLTQAADRAKGCGEFGEQAQLLHLIGRAYYSRAEYRIALDYWTQGMQVAGHGADPISWSWCKLGIGQICDALETSALAVKIFSELGQALVRLDGSARALPIAQRPRFAMRLRELRIVNTVNLGVNELRLNQYQAALANFRHAQSMAHAEGLSDIAWECHVLIAETAFLQGDANSALEHLQSSKKPLEDCSHHWGLASLHLLRAQCQARLGQLSDALASLELARASSLLANAKHMTLRIERETADVAEKSGDLASALEAMKRVSSLQTALERSAKSQLLRDLEALSVMRAGPQSPRFTN
jgi:tetratricopeptide (TPR) repeat protein